MKEGLKILPKALREKKRYVVFSLNISVKEIRGKIKDLFGEFGLEKCDIKEIGKNVLRCNLKGLNNVGTAIVLLEGKILKVSGSVKGSRKD